MRPWRLVRAKQTQRNDSICAATPDGAAREGGAQSWMFGRVGQPLNPGAAHPTEPRRARLRTPGARDPSAEMARQFEVWG